MSETILQASNSVSTILGMLNQTQSFLDIPYVSNLPTTLNVKYGILNTVTPPYVPTLQYYGIGITGYQNLDDQQYARPFVPKATNMDLYGPIPFRCVPLAHEANYDFSNYRMRREITVGSTRYVTYYLKKLIFDPQTILIIHKDADGIETAYTLDPGSFLSPSPPVISGAGEVNTNQNRVIIRATAKCEITGEEVNEVVSVLYGGDSRYARISELGFYTGCEVWVNNAGVYQPGATTGYRQEAAYVQLAKHQTSLGIPLANIGDVAMPYISIESSSCIEI